MLSSVSSLQSKMAFEIEHMRDMELSEPRAHDVMVRVARARALPASQLPKVIEHWEEMHSNEFGPTGWGLFNAFTAVIGQHSQRLQMDNTLRLTAVFRESLAL